MLWNTGGNWSLSQTHPITYLYLMFILWETSQSSFSPTTWKVGDIIGYITHFLGSHGTDDAPEDHTTHQPASQQLKGLYAYSFVFTHILWGPSSARLCSRYWSETMEDEESKGYPLHLSVISQSSDYTIPAVS